MDETQPPKPDSQPPKKRKVGEKTVVTVRVETAAGKSSKGAEGPPSDPWSWRKYGQKPIKGSPYPRGYYRCSTSKGCSAKKQVERSSTDPSVLIVTYTSDHNHPGPAAPPGSPAGDGGAKELAGHGGRDPNAAAAPPVRTEGELERNGLPLGGARKEGNSPEPAAESPEEEEEDDFFDDLEELPAVSSSAAGWVRSGGSFDEKVILPLPVPLLQDH